MPPKKGRGAAQAAAAKAKAAKAAAAAAAKEPSEKPSKPKPTAKSTKARLYARVAPFISAQLEFVPLSSLASHERRPRNVQADGVAKLLVNIEANGKL